MSVTKALARDRAIAVPDPAMEFEVAEAFNPPYAIVLAAKRSWGPTPVGECGGLWDISTIWPARCATTWYPDCIDLRIRFRGCLTGSWAQLVKSRSDKSGLLFSQRSPKFPACMSRKSIATKEVDQ